MSTRASFSGVAFVCNRVAFVSANCTDRAGKACIDDSDCEGEARCRTTFPDGVGLGIQFPKAGPCACAEPPCSCVAPSVTLERVATTGNRGTTDGANLQLNVPGTTLAAGGTQWEDCASSACDDAAEDAIRATNVREASGARVELLPLVSSEDGSPSLTAVSPARPRAGEIVRVYGAGFDAIDGNALPTSCRNPPARDADFCDPSEPALAQINRGSAGNRLRLFIGSQSWVLDVAAVTPTMLAFRMPVDCFAPATIELRRGGQAVRIPACDPDGCGGQPAGVACADDGNACTGDVCDGAGTCVHAALPAATTCRPAAGPCDLDELCDGTGSPCPADGKHVAGHVCRKAAGLCDRPETCSGTADVCPDDQVREPTRICRAAVGTCDVAEACDGSTPTCPVDRVRPAGDVCRAAAGVCDVAETCDGATGLCPEDAKSIAPCRAAAGPCDLEERCSGTSDVCPDDARAPAGTVCRAAAGVCDVAERCDGGSAACPTDALAAAGTVCRAARDACDLVETCSGAAASCPAAARESGFAAVECRLVALDALVAQGVRSTTAARDDARCAGRLAAATRRGRVRSGTRARRPQATPARVAAARARRESRCARSLPPRSRHAADPHGADGPGTRPRDDPAGAVPPVAALCCRRHSLDDARRYCKGSF